MMKKLFAFLLLALSVNSTYAQQTVTLTGSVTVPAFAEPYSQVITINGLPPGCVAAIAGTIITVTGCPSSLPVTVTVNCTPVNISPGGTVTCAATVANAANTAVQWSSSSGTISPAGVLIAPTTAGSVTITARSAQDNTKSGSAVITVVVPATPMQVEAESASASSGAINIQPTQDTGGGNKVVATIVGQTFDYTLNVPTAGTYTLAIRICNFPSATGTTAVHFEYPLGNNVSGSITLLNGAQWTTVPALVNKTVNLPAGSQIIRLVVDAVASGGTLAGQAPGTQLNWFSLTPIAGSVGKTVKLTWNPSTSTAIVGYNVYRASDPPFGTFARLNVNPVLNSPFIDTTVVPQGAYGYVVTTIGDATYGNNESVYSNESDVTLP